MHRVGEQHHLIIAHVVQQVFIIPSTDEQRELFASPQRKVSEVMDKINDRYGEFVITPALMLGMENTILDRIAFGGVKELEEIYTD
jgi:trehalose-6-phosphate synthase